MAERTLDTVTKVIMKSVYKNTCAICGKDSERTEIDHIIPLWEGGTDTAENLQVLCIECHRKKSADEYRRFAKLNPVVVVRDGVIIKKQEG